MSVLGSCFSYLSLWNWDLTKVTGPSKALKYTEVLDLILGEGSLDGCPWTLGKGHEGKENYDPIMIQLLTLPWCFLSLSMFLSQIFPCFGVYSSMQPSLAPLMGACMQRYLGVGLALPGSWPFLL